MIIGSTGSCYTSLDGGKRSDPDLFLGDTVCPEVGLGVYVNVIRRLMFMVEDKVKVIRAVW